MPGKLASELLGFSHLYLPLGCRHVGNIDALLHLSLCGLWGSELQWTLDGKHLSSEQFPQPSLTSINYLHFSVFSLLNAYEMKWKLEHHAILSCLFETASDLVLHKLVSGSQQFCLNWNLLSKASEHHFPPDNDHLTKAHKISCSLMETCKYSHSQLSRCYYKYKAMKRKQGGWKWLRHMHEYLLYKPKPS